MKKELFDKIKSKYENSSSAMEDYKKKLNTFRDMYLCQRPNKKTKSLANVYVPEFFKAIETLASNIFQIVFSEDPFFYTVGKNAEDQLQASIIQKLMEVFIQDMKLKENAIQIFRSLFIDSIVIVKLTWKNEIRRVTKKVKNGLGTQDIEVNEVVADYPELELCNIYDIFLDPTSSSIADAEWIIERKKMSYAQMKNLQRQGLIDEFDDDDEIIRKAENTTSDDLQKRQMESMGFRIDALEKKEYEILDYFGYIKKSEVKQLSEGEEDEDIPGRVILCLNTKKILKKSINPFWHQMKPYISCSLFKMDNSMFGVSLGDIIKKSQDELNDIHNQMLDENTFNLFNVTLRNRNSGIKKADIKAEPGWVIDGDMIGEDALRFVKPQVNTMITAAQTAERVREDIKQSMGALAIMQGVPTAKRQTKAEVNALFGEGSVRVKSYALNVAENLIKPILSMVYSLIQQYMDTNKVISIIGQDGIQYQTVTPEQVVGDYDFTPKLMTDYLNKIVIRENLLEFIGIASKVPGMLSPQSLQYLMRKYYDLLEFKDGKQVFPEPAPTAQDMSGLPPAGGGQGGELDPETQQAAEDVLNQMGI